MIAEIKEKGRFASIAAENYPRIFSGVLSHTYTPMDWKFKLPNNLPTCSAQVAGRTDNVVAGRRD